MRLTKASIVCVMLGALGASGAANRPPALDGSVLEVNGAFGAPLLTVKGGYPKLHAGFVVRANPLELTFSSEVSEAFAKWLIASQAGKLANPLAVLRIAGGSEVDRLVLPSATLAALEIRNLGAQPRPLEFLARLDPGSASVVGGGKAGVSIPIVNAEPYTVRLVIDGKHALLPISLTGIGMESPRDVATGQARAQGTCKGFDATFVHADIGYLYDWYNTGVLLQVAGRPSLPAARQVVVEVVTSAKNKPTPLATLQGVRIASFEPITADFGLGVAAEFFCERFTLIGDVFQ